MQRYNPDYKYMLPMSKLNHNENDEELVKPDITIGNKGQCIKCTKQGYRSKYFHTEYFDYLISTGYVKELS